MKNKKILVTGGAGFIGSHLCEALAQENVVTSLDNYLTGSKDNHVANVKYMTGSVKNINSLLENDEFDYIFHFGEYSRVEQSMNEPALCFQNGLESFYNVLEYARNKKSKIVYAGSSTKFTDNNTGYKLCPYAYQKDANTRLIRLYRDWFDLEYTTVYFYNAYGPREIQDTKYATVVAKFLKLAGEGAKTLPVSSPGTQVRNFTHVKDIVSGILLAAEYGDGDGYGIGSDEGFTIIELCKMIGCEATIYPSPKGNRLSAPVKNEAVKRLGWRPKYQLQKYISDELEKRKKKEK